MPALAVSGCSSLVFDEEAPEADPEEEVVDPTDDEPQTIQDRFPLIRFLPHGDDVYSAFITLPITTGPDILASLCLICTCDDRTGPDQVIFEILEGGTQLGDATKKPWEEGSVSKYQPIEDILLVRGYESDIEEVLSALDLWYNSAPQIEIQAMVFEVIDSAAFERGVTPNGDTLITWADEANLVRGFDGIFPSSSSGVGGVFQLGFIDGDVNFNARLQLLEEEGFVSIMSTPSIVTRNGVPASLGSTERVPYLKPAQISLAGTAAFTVEYNEVGITLNVVPFLVGKDTVHLVANAEVSRIGRDIVVGTDANGNAILAPTTTKRDATVNVFVKNGTKIVFGGLKRKEERTVESRLPILGSIPILGWLFSSKEVSSNDLELYFVLTPVVKVVPTIDPIGDIFDPYAD